MNCDSSSSCDSAQGSQSMHDPPWSCPIQRYHQSWIFPFQAPVFVCSCRRHRRKRAAFLAISLLMVQALNLAFFIVPNAAYLDCLCCFNTRNDLIEAAACIRWSCWNLVCHCTIFSLCPSKSAPGVLVAGALLQADMCMLRCSSCSSYMSLTLAVALTFLVLLQLGCLL